MKEYRHYLNGQYVIEDELLVSPRDLGFSRSFAVFEYLRTYNGRPFKLNEYLGRLLRSAELLNLKHNYNLEQLTEIVEDALDKNNDGNEKAIKIILSGGISNSIYQSREPTLAVMIDLLKLKNGKIYKDGVKVGLVKFVRYLPEAKSTNYIEGVRQAQAGTQDDVYERVYFSDKRVHEGVTSNIFAVKNGKIYTPKNNVLLGITRGVLLKDLNGKLRVIEKDFDLNFLLNADEVFITSSGKKIVPVVRADKNIIGNGKIGKITKQVMEDFEEFTNETDKPNPRRKG